LYSCLRCATASKDPPPLLPITSPETTLLLSSSATYPGLICNRHAFSQSFGLPPLPCPTVACLLFATAGAEAVFAPAVPPMGNVLVCGPSSSWNCTSAFGPNRKPTPSFESVPENENKIIYNPMKTSDQSLEKRVISEKVLKNLKHSTYVFM